jgi:hypothetical protein
MPIWYAHSSNTNINAAGLWHTHPTNNTPVDFATCDGTVVLFANGKINIRINTSFTCKELTTVTQLGGSIGGNFVFKGRDIAGNPTGAIKITGDVIANEDTCILIQDPADATTPLEIEGTIRGISNSGLVFQSNAHVTVNGNVIGDGCFGIQMMYGGSPYVCITGDVIGSSTDVCEGVFCEADGATIVINGNLTGSMGSAVTLSGYSINLIINGNVYGGIEMGGYGIYIYGGENHVSINGICQGSGFASGLYCEASEVYIIADQVIGGDNSNNGIHIMNADAYLTARIVQGGTGYGCGICSYNAPANHIVITESLIGGLSEGSYGFNASGWMGIGAAVIKGNIIDTLACNAYNGAVLVDNTSANYYQTYHASDNGTGNQPRRFPLQLSAESVKKGIQHGNIIGSLAPASPFRRLNRLV